MPVLQEVRKGVARGQRPGPCGQRFTSPPSPLLGQRHGSSPTCASQASWGRGPQLQRAASGENSSWEAKGFTHKTGEDQAFGLSLIPCSEPPTNFPQGLPAFSSKPPKSRSQIQSPKPSPNSSRQKQPRLWAPILGNPGPGAGGSRTGPPSPAGLCGSVGWGCSQISPLADPSTAQLPGSLISMRHSPSVTTATSCSAPSGVTAPAILVKGRPVPCPVYPWLRPAWPAYAPHRPPLSPRPEISAPSSCPAGLGNPSPHRPVASAPPPTPWRRGYW